MSSVPLDSEAELFNKRVEELMLEHKQRYPELSETSLRALVEEMIESYFFENKEPERPH